MSISKRAIILATVVVSIIFAVLLFVVQGFNSMRAKILTFAFYFVKL